MQEIKKINPLIALAAVSVILCSIVGIGVMTGLIPNSFSKGKESALETGASKPAAEETKTRVGTCTDARSQQDYFCDMTNALNKDWAIQRFCS